MQPFRSAVPLRTTQVPSSALSQPVQQNCLALAEQSMSKGNTCTEAKSTCMLLKFCSQVQHKCIRPLKYDWKQLLPPRTSWFCATSPFHSKAVWKSCLTNEILTPWNQVCILVESTLMVSIRIVQRNTWYVSICFVNKNFRVKWKEGNLDVLILTDKIGYACGVTISFSLAMHCIALVRWSSCHGKDQSTHCFLCLNLYWEDLSSVVQGP